jgi:hypothetical protein
MPNRKKKDEITSVSPAIAKQVLAEGRLTSKKFIAWINSEFERFEIKEYKVIKAERTRFRSQDYEGGACKLIVTFQHVDKPQLQGNFLCFYFLSEYESYIQTGKYKMALNFSGRFHSLTDLTVDLVKVR